MHTFRYAQMSPMSQADVHIWPLAIKSRRELNFGFRYKRYRVMCQYRVITNRGCNILYMYENVHLHVVIHHSCMQCAISFFLTKGNCAHPEHRRTRRLDDASRLAGARLQGILGSHSLRTLPTLAPPALHAQHAEMHYFCSLERGSPAAVQRAQAVQL